MTAGPVKWPAEVESARVDGMPLPVTPDTVRSAPAGALPPRVISHMSGGRDRWSAPLAQRPADPVAAVRDCLREVLDPEIPISVVDLGLIYGIELGGDSVRVKLTYTATGCPCMEFIREDIRDRLQLEWWIGSVELEEVWDPPWTTERITSEGRAQLGQFGVGV